MHFKLTPKPIHNQLRVLVAKPAKEPKVLQLGQECIFGQIPSLVCAVSNNGNKNPLKMTISDTNMVACSLGLILGLIT